MPETFVPTIYVRQGCPFCLKLRLFLLEAGLLPRVRLQDGQTEDEHRELAAFLTTRLGKASFPTAEIAPGEFLADSDALVAHFAGEAGIDPARLPIFQAYVGHVMPRLTALFQENAALKKRLEGAGLAAAA